MDSMPREANDIPLQITFTLNTSDKAMTCYIPTHRETRTTNNTCAAMNPTVGFGFFLQTR